MPSTGNVGSIPTVGSQQSRPNYNQKTKMKKFVVSFLAALVLTACSSDQSATAALPPSTSPQETTGAVHFIQICSGITISQDDNTGLQDGIIAVANCLGRIRGYADGSMVTSEVTQTAKLWCVPAAQTDQQVMATVLEWIDKNPERYEKFVNAFDDRTAAAATIIQALRETYTCRTT